MVYSPRPPLWNRTSLLRFCGFPTAAPPLWNRMVFPFAIHTHTPCLCECMAILSPKPPPVEQDGFPFCSETHTHTHIHHVSVYVWHSLSVHALLRGAARLSWGSSRPRGFRPLYLGGGYHWGGGKRGGENAQRTTIYTCYTYIYMTICI